MYSKEDFFFLINDVTTELNRYLSSADSARFCQQIDGSCAGHSSARRRYALPKLVQRKL